MMAEKTTERKRTRAHTVYKTKDGKRVPGVTTITGILDKPALVKWANNLGLQGIDSRKYVDALAGIGTLAHNMVECEFTGETVDTSEFSQADISAAENSVLSFYAWQKQHEIETVGNELQLVSEVMGFGGTCDIYCILDGVPTLLDLKTGKGIWPEMKMQVSAYRYLLLEHGYKVEDVRILRIGRDENEGFEDHRVTNLDTYFEIFKHCYQIYQLKKEVSWR
jgi:hypothetical protein